MIKHVRQVFYKILNYLWAGMMIIGTLQGVFHGQLPVVTEGALQSSKEAVTLCIAMLGVMSLQTGVLGIGHRSGPVSQLAGRMSPLFTFLFPRLSSQDEARKQIAINMIANILGLGWAATPAEIKAMEELKKAEEDRGEYRGRTAGNEICTFLIINISSLQLTPMSIITYRSQYGSVNPTATVEPALVATFLSAVVAMIFYRVIDGKRSPWQLNVSSYSSRAPSLPGGLPCKTGTRCAIIWAHVKAARKGDRR